VGPTQSIKWGQFRVAKSIVRAEALTCRSRKGFYKGLRCVCPEVGTLLFAFTMTVRYSHLEASHRRQALELLIPKGTKQHKMAR
jgi:hypothetical protein